jgi:hypothetical protein
MTAACLPQISPVKYVTFQMRPKNFKQHSMSQMKSFNRVVLTCLLLIALNASAPAQSTEPMKSAPANDTLRACFRRSCGARRATLAACAQTATLVNRRGLA